MGQAAVTDRRGLGTWEGPLCEEKRRFGAYQ
jgi:hypothetical protein